MRDVLELLLEQPDGTTSVELSRDEYVALQAEVRRYNTRYMRNTGERRGVMSLGMWNHENKTAPLTIRAHERISRYGVRKGSVRHQLEALAVGETIELDPSEIDVANVRTAAYNIGRGVFKVHTYPGLIAVTRILPKPDTTRPRSFREQVFAHMKNYEGPREFQGNPKTIRMYVSQWNATNATKFSATATKHGAVVSLRQASDESGAKARFLADMVSRAEGKGDATDEELARFKEIARWVVSTLSEPAWAR